MTIDETNGFTIIEVEGTQYALMQALADGFYIAAAINTIDSALSDVKIIKVQ